MKVRIFCQDVGTTGYSGYDDDEDGLVNPMRLKNRLKVLNSAHQHNHIAIPRDMRELWPDGKTGEVPKEALRYGA